MLVKHISIFTGMLLFASVASAQLATTTSSSKADSDSDRAISLIYDGKVTEVTRMLEQGLDPNAKTDWGSPLLFVAVSTKQPELAKILIERGADVNAKGEAQKIPIFNNACFNGDLPLVNLLLKHGADPTATDLFGGTALEDAAHSGSKPLVEKLRKLGLQTKWPLHVAAGIGDVNTVKHLINKENVNQGRKGWYDTPLNFAASGGHGEVIKVLLDFGANPNLPDAAEGFPLHYAAETGSIEICRVLIEAGADVNAHVGDANPPLSSANNDKLRMFLRKQGAMTWEELSFRSGPSLADFWRAQLLQNQPSKKLKN